jgi:hypothetical protein
MVPPLRLALMRSCRPFTRQWRTSPTRSQPPRRCACLVIQLHLNLLDPFVALESTGISV